jgi:signal transduction histidine kinase
MRRRVLAAILGVTALGIVLFAVPLAIVVGRLVGEDAILRVERQAVLASRSVPENFIVGGDPVELPPATDGIVLALYDERGVLVAGSGPAPADAITLQALRNEVTDTRQGEALVVAVPVAVDELVVGAIRAEQSTAAADARAHRITALLAGLALAVLSVAAVIGWVVSGRLARPVLRLRDAAVQLGDGDFAIDVGPSGLAELDQAAAAMMVTAQRLDSLLERERTFSADVSHQLRTPLAGIRAAVETELAFPRPDPSEVLQDILNDVDRLQGTIDEVLAIARATDEGDATTSPADLLAEIEARWQGRFDRAGRRLTIPSARFDPPVRGHAAMLGQALDALLANALEHGAGEVRVELTAGENSVTLRVTDEGPGFAVAPRSPEATGDPAAAPAARGLGLPLARRMIEAMPGRMVVCRAGPRPQIDIVLQRADATNAAGDRR